MSGRRLRDINQEKRLKEQLQKKLEKEKERLEQRKKKFASLNEQPKHIFNDSSFYKEEEEITNSLFNSVDKGLKVAEQHSNKDEAKASSSDQNSNSGSDANEEDRVKLSLKRKSTDSSKPAKKRRFFDDLDESSDDSD